MRVKNVAISNDVSRPGFCESGDRGKRRGSETTRRSS